MDLSIVIPTYDRGPVISANLPALLREVEQSDKAVEVLVINDYRADNDREALIPHPAFHFFNNPGQGVSSARNFGASQAQSAHLLFMDDDIQVLPGTLARVFDFIDESDGRTSLNCDWTYPEQMDSELNRTSFGRRLLDLKLNSLRGWMGEHSKWEQDKRIDDVKAASYFLYVPKDVFLSIDGYDESYPYAGFEDGDFADRLREKGFLTALDTRFKVLHNEFDRLDLKTWLARKQREGATRAHSVSLGNQRYALNPSLLRKFLMKATLLIPDAGIRLIGNSLSPRLDGLHHKILAALEASYIWKGYVDHSQSR